MANNNKRKLDGVNGNPVKRRRKEEEEEEKLAGAIDDMIIDYAPLITPLSAPAGLAATSTRLTLGRNPGIPEFSISRFLDKWINDLKPQIRQRFWQRMSTRELVEQRLVTTRILLEFMQYLTHELAPFLWQNELCYGLDTNDWLKTTKEFEDRHRYSSLLARIYNRYMRSNDETINPSILNNYQEWFTLAGIIEQGTGLSQDFAIHFSSEDMLNKHGPARSLFPFHSNVPRFVSKLLVLPHCQWPVIVTPNYAGFVVHQKKGEQNIVLVYAFALPYAITCLPEYIDFRPSVVRRGKVRFHLAFDEPVPWRDGEPRQSKVIEYVDLELDLLAMEKHVLNRLANDTMHLITVDKRDDAPFGASQNDSSSSSPTPDSPKNSLFIAIPHERGAYVSMRPAATQLTLNGQALFRGVYTTEQDARLRYNHRQIVFDADVNNLMQKQQPQQRTAWMSLLEAAAQSTPNAFLRKFSILRDFKHQDELSLFTSDAEKCSRLAKFMVRNAKNGEYILDNVEVAADRGEVYLAILQYRHRERFSADGIHKNLLELFTLTSSDMELIKRHLTNHVTIALAFTKNQSNASIDSQSPFFWRVSLLFVGVGVPQKLSQSLHVNNCVVGYCHEGITWENKLQAHVLQMSWSFIHQACGIKNNEFPEIDEQGLGLLDYGHVLTLPIDDMKNGLHHARQYYSCAISHWQMSRGMVIVYSNHHSAGNNQLDQSHWINATFAHYDCAHWMVTFAEERKLRYYTATLSGSHVRAYDSLVYDKGIFYQTTAHTLDPNEFSFSQMFDYEANADEEERKPLQRFDLSVVHYTEQRSSISPPQSPINVDADDDG